MVGHVDGYCVCSPRVCVSPTHSWFNTLAMLALFVLAATALGLGAAALASVRWCVVECTLSPR